MPLNNSAAPMLQPQAAYVEREQDRLETVHAGQNKNVFVGFGVTSIVMGVGLIALAWRVWTIAANVQAQWGRESLFAVAWCLVAFGLGGIAFGLISAWRNSIDEWNASQQKKELHEANQELGYQVAELQAALNSANHQLQIKTSQAAMLANMAPEDRRTVDETPYRERQMAANELISRAAEGQSVARDPVTKNTWISKAMWHSAGDLLQAVGLAEWSNSDGTGKLTVHVDGVAAAQEAYARTEQWRLDEIAAQYDNFVQP